MSENRANMPLATSTSKALDDGAAALHRPGLLVTYTMPEGSNGVSESSYGEGAAALREKARALAKKTGGTFVDPMHSEASAPPSTPTPLSEPTDPNHAPKDSNPSLDSTSVLTVSPEAIALSADDMTLTCDLAHMLARLKPARIAHEMVVRAARIKGVPDALVVDATAGLGEDSLLLAAAGHRVILFERDPAIAALLADGLRRAADDPRLVEATSRMRLIEGDSIEGLTRIQELAGVRPDVVLLDPMFPTRTKDARVKKKLQLLQHLEAPCDDEKELMNAALAAEPRKVVVKRPIKGPLLAGVKPSYSVSGKAVRFDVIVPARS